MLEDRNGRDAMKLVVFTMKTLKNIHIVNQLNSSHSFDGMVILNHTNKNKKQVFDFWFKKLREKGIKKTINRFIYQKYVQNNKNENEVMKNFFKETEFKYKKNILMTEDINSDDVYRFLNTISPDIIAVCGSNLIKSRIFNIPKKGTINIHAGITPDYRCAHPVEWAIYNKEFDKVGVTIHFVNEGIDTGDIIYQKVTKIEKGDTISTIYCKNAISGAILMKRAIKNISKGILDSKVQDLKKGKKYLSFDYGFIENMKVKRTLKITFN